MFLTLFLIATITFFLMKLLPGSPYANEEQLTVHINEPVHADGKQSIQIFFTESEEE